MEGKRASPPPGPNKVLQLFSGSQNNIFRGGFMNKFGPVYKLPAKDRQITIYIIILQNRVKINIK